MTGTWHTKKKANNNTKKSQLKFSFLCAAPRFVIENSCGACLVVLGSARVLSDVKSAKQFEVLREFALFTQLTKEQPNDWWVNKSLARQNRGTSHIQVQHMFLIFRANSVEFIAGLGAA